MADFTDEGMDVDNHGPLEDDAMDVEATPALIVQNSTLDLETYIADYVGRNRLLRLSFIAQKCPPLKTEALRRALNELAHGFRPTLQQEFAAELKSSNPSEALVVPNDSQIQEMVTKNTRQRDAIELTLKQCRANKVKESIRTAYTELGDHLYESGELSAAMKTYQRCRDYSTSSEHVVQMCLNVMKVALELPNWSHLLSYVTKAESAAEKENLTLVAELKCYAGLAHLSLRSYETAALLFLQCTFDDAVIPHIMSRKDIATYGALCALASFSRAELKTKVIENPGFKEFLELFPAMRELVKQFYASQYGTCLAFMDKIKSDLLLDYYLSDHVEFLYKKIREKMLVQYFSPFLSVDMTTMAAQFNSTVEDLEHELTDLITKKAIQARIDSDKKVLHARKVNQRATTFKNAIEVGKTYKIHMQAILLRAALTKANVSVGGNGRSERGDQGGRLDILAHADEAMGLG